MPDRHFPVRPDFDRLQKEALALQSTEAIPLDEAQQSIARSYGLRDWTRLNEACRMTNAIWAGDVETVRGLILANPALLHEDARGIKGNWGPPMSYAANLGQDAIIDLLHEMGADDVQFAFERACLQGQLHTARRLFAMGARPQPGSIMGPSETQSGTGLALQLELGAPWGDASGDRLAPVALILQTYSRNPEGKHRCLQLAESQGITLSDTPPMAVHRGRLDLLEQHLGRDPQLLSRTFTHEEIYPPELGCDPDHSLALHGTPLAGGTLLHLCVDGDEIEIARWLLDHGANPDTPAALNPDGFGGHTALFGCVVSQPYVANQRRDAAFAELLLDRGANPNIRASLRKKLRFVEDETTHEYRDVTPLGWGERFHQQDWVNRAAMHLIHEQGGTV